MDDTPRSRGLLSSLRGLVTTAVAIAQTRLELLGVELREETARILALLAYGAAALLLLAAGIVFLAIFLTVLLWDSHRLLVLGVFTALFLGGGGLALAVAVRRARQEPQLFAASVAELLQDRTALESRPSHEP
jgi:uncharacterized membrane protein YqjE